MRSWIVKQFRTEGVMRPRTNQKFDEKKNKNKTGSILRLGAFGPSNEKTTLLSYRYTQMFQDELIIPADTWYVSDFI